MQLNWTRDLRIGAGALAKALWAWGGIGLRASRRVPALELAAASELPPSSYSSPVILVCGDAQAALFGAVETEALALRVTEQGCYVRVPELEQLPYVLEGVLSERPQWIDQVSVIYVVNPCEHQDHGSLIMQLRRFRHQLTNARKHGAALPLFVVNYQPVPQGAARWFTYRVGPEMSVQEGVSQAGWTTWQQDAGNMALQAQRLQCSVQIRSALEWAAQYVLPHLHSVEPRVPATPCVAYAIGMLPVAPLCVPGNLWSRWLEERAGLMAGFGSASSQAQWPLPDPLLQLLPRPSTLMRRRRVRLKPLWLCASAMAIALLSSAWQNQKLLHRLNADLQQYEAIPVVGQRDQPEYVLKKQALQVLQQDASLLDEYYRHGVPLFLGLGLYRGEHLRPLLRTAIAGYREPGMAVIQPATVSQTTVRLDSLSLFETASASLKPESSKVLISALVGIKAQPGWLIVIAGHTDATGDPVRNQALSRARAEAVRDWLRRMGDIPDSCFAVQGMGAEQPVSSNDTPEGRAANRRVDIRLVPVAGACSSARQVSDIHPESQRKTATSL